MDYAIKIQKLAKTYVGLLPEFVSQEIYARLESRVIGALSKQIELRGQLILDAPELDSAQMDLYRFQLDQLGGIYHDMCEIRRRMDLRVSYEIWKKFESEDSRAKKAFESKKGCGN